MLITLESVPFVHSHFHYFCLAPESLLKLSSTKHQNFISNSVTIQNSLLFFSNITELSVDCLFCACSYLHIESPSPLPLQTSNSCTDVISMKPSWTPFLVLEHSYTFMSRWTWTLSHWYYTPKLHFRWDGKSVY